MCSIPTRYSRIRTINLKLARSPAIKISSQKGNYFCEYHLRLVAHVAKENCFVFARLFMALITSVQKDGNEEKWIHVLCRANL